jgi:hypothetical protein
MSTDSPGETPRFALDTQRFKTLGITDPKSREALDAYDHHEFSSAERLFFKLWGSDLLNSGLFNPGQKIAERGEHPVFAHVIISGEVVAMNDQGSHLFGPGSVFGLAEGLIDDVYQWDAVARTVVTTKVIPIDRALREVRRLNSGLKGICRFTTMRILGLSSPPPSLS